MKNLQTETQRHSTAFAYYLQLGGERSYAEVTRKFGFSETSVRKWAKSFQWGQRVTEADAKANAAQRGHAEEGYIKTVEDFRSLKWRSLAELSERVNKGHCSVMELVQILRVVKVELNEPTHITAMPQQSQTRDPFGEILAKLFPLKQDATV